MQIQIALPVEKEDMHGTVTQFLGMNEGSLLLSDDVVVLVHHVKELRGIGARGARAGVGVEMVGQGDPLLQRKRLSADRHRQAHR